MQLDNGGRRMFFEDFGRRRFYYADSYDTFKTWTTPAELPGLSGTVKHLTVVKETVTGGVELPLNTTRSFQSVNFPDRYMRHRGFLGYTDPVDASSTSLTKQDATLTVVAGLADPNCYSLRTASGLYLRHSAFRIRVDANGGTATFVKDATFNAHPGTASGSVAVESYNCPGYYIRHRNGELWVDRYAATDLFRADRGIGRPRSAGDSGPGPGVPRDSHEAVKIVFFWRSIEDSRLSTPVRAGVAVHELGQGLGLGRNPIFQLHC